MKRLFLLLFIDFIVNLPVFSQCADTLSIWSDAMQKELSALIITPRNMKADTHYPVVYLLHGFGSNYSRWYNLVQPRLPELATQYGLILVCPEGENSWYFDSPELPSSRFETYITKEVVDYVDGHYPTCATKEGRAITGFSMGGHGALYLTARHPELFGACGAMSGAVNIRLYPDRYTMADKLGAYEKYPERWERSTAFHALTTLKPEQAPAIILDCGTQDFFYRDNLELHEYLLNQGIAHDFISRPGGHTAAYWQNAVLYQLLFFSEYFRKNCESLYDTYQE